jgi:hypothetical protein
MAIDGRKNKHYPPTYSMVRNAMSIIYHGEAPGTAFACLLKSLYTEQLGEGNLRPPSPNDTRSLLITNEAVMAKGQNRSNREPKTPKAKKPEPAGPFSTFLKEKPGAGYGANR